VQSNRPNNERLPDNQANPSKRINSPRHGLTRWCWEYI